MQGLNKAREVLNKVRPRSVVYLFSGGKDSSAAIATTRDVVKRYVKERVYAKVYILYTLIPGNTHPVNTYTSARIMEWHRKYYGFIPVFLSSNRVFQEFLKKYGFKRGKSRWCYVEFKWKLWRTFLRKLPRPLLVIDGMKPADSSFRKKYMKSWLEYWERDGLKFWSWHPLFYITENDKIWEVLEQAEPFQIVVDLYKTYGDSLNCVVCPYRDRKKLLLLPELDRRIYYDYIACVVKSSEDKKRFRLARNRNITSYLSTR